MYVHWPYSFLQYSNLSSVHSAFYWFLHLSICNEKNKFRLINSIVMSTKCLLDRPICSSSWYICVDLYQLPDYVCESYQDLFSKWYGYVGDIMSVKNMIPLTDWFLLQPRHTVSHKRVWIITILYLTLHRVSIHNKRFQRGCKAQRTFSLLLSLFSE